MTTPVPTPFEKYKAAYDAALSNFRTRNPDATELDYLDREIKLNDCVIHAYENEGQLSSRYEGMLTTESEYYTALRKDEFLWNRKKELLPDVSLLFEEAETVKPIRWHGTLGQLIYLFEELQSKNFFSLTADLQFEIRKHFTDLNGKPYVHTRQVKQNYKNTKTGKPKLAKEIEEIVDHLKGREK